MLQFMMFSIYFLCFLLLPPSLWRRLSSVKRCRPSGGSSGTFRGSVEPDLDASSLIFKGLHEFEAQKNHEVNEFRTKMRTFCEERSQERQALPWQRWMEYCFPCDLEPCSSPPQCGSAKSKGTKKIFINVKFEACDVSLL